MSDQEELFQKYLTEIEQLEAVGFRIHLSLSPTQAAALVGTIQLALRHPQFKGPTSIFALQFVRMMAQEFEGRAPATAEVIRRGGLKEYDEPRARNRHQKKGGNHA